MIDTEELEQEFEEGSNQTPEVKLPEHPAGKSKDRQELIDETLEEAGQSASQESVIDELAKKDEELTIEDLRKLPGSEGLTDEQIKAEWEKATASEASGTQTEGQGESFKLPFPVYDAQGNKIEALEKISVRDLFEGKIQLGYNALGKEQRKTLAEAIRNASMGHWNEQKYNTTVEERNKVATELAQAKEQVKEFGAMRQTWDSALTALSMGNIEPLRQLAAAWQKELLKSPQATPGMVPIDQVKADQEQVNAGNQYIRENIYPAAVEIASKYQADTKEVLGAVEWFLRRDAQFLTKEKIDSILQYDVPQLLEANGYSTTGAKTSGTPVAQQSNDVEELKKTVAALQSRIAETKNEQTANVRTKSKKAPPAGGGATPGAGDAMPSFKSRAQMKAWMQGDENWQAA